MQVSTIYEIRQKLGCVGIPLLLITGNASNFFVVLMLGRSMRKRASSCSLYLLFASLANWLLIDTALVSTFYGMNHLEATHASNTICKLRWYGGHVLFMLSRCCSKSNAIFLIAHGHCSRPSDRCMYRSLGTLLEQRSDSITLSAVHCSPCSRFQCRDFDAVTYPAAYLL